MTKINSTWLRWRIGRAIVERKEKQKVVGKLVHDEDSAVIRELLHQRAGSCNEVWLLTAFSCIISASYRQDCVQLKHGFFFLEKGVGLKVV